MKKTTPARTNVVVLKQILNLIPLGLINRHASETGVDARSRSSGVLSHLSAMLFAQLSHAIGTQRCLRLASPQISRPLAFRHHPAIQERPFPCQQETQWERLDLLAFLKSYGTASVRFKVIGALDTAWLPGFAPVRT